MDKIDLKCATTSRLCRLRKIRLYLATLSIVVVVLFLIRWSQLTTTSRRKVPILNREQFPTARDDSFLGKDSARGISGAWNRSRNEGRNWRQDQQEKGDPDPGSLPKRNPDDATLTDPESPHGYLVYGEHESIFSRIRWPEGTRLHGSEPKIIDWYNAPTWLKRRGHNSLFSGCPVQSCSVHYDGKLSHRADALLISSTDIPSPEPPARKPGQMWVLVTMEAPTKQGHFYKTPKWVGSFNWTLTYRRDSDIWLPYGFLRSLADPRPRNFTRLFQQKSRSVSWMVSNMHAQNRRHEYVAMLKKFIPVHMYGKCRDLCTRWNGSEMWNDYVTKHYRFYLSFENNNCRDYTSEKFLKTFTSDVVPVVRGGPWFEYGKFFPKGTFVDTSDFRTIRELAEHLRSLEQKPQEYTAILQRRSHYVLGNHADFVAAAMCQMCVKLHNLDKFNKTYPNMEEWMVNGACNNEVKDLVMQ